MTLTRQERRAVLMEAESFVAARERGTFRGLASRYSVPFENSHGEWLVILPGAFASAVADFSHVRLLREHDRNQIIGTITKLEETDVGLYVEGRFANTPLGQEVAELARTNAMPEMSVGFNITRQSYVMRDKKRVKQIHEAELFDVSCVSWGANPGARLQEAASRILGTEAMEIVAQAETDVQCILYGKVTTDDTAAPITGKDWLGRAHPTSAQAWEREQGRRDREVWEEAQREWAAAHPQHLSRGAW